MLIDFWTYSCINCIRTLPYVKSWDARYRDRGLVIVGVHTPEFAFEHVLANVRAAVRSHGIEYPVAIDNDYGTWQAYGNEYWPADYLIDRRGHVRDVHFGEGQYAATERAIQQLLGETAGGSRRTACGRSPRATTSRLRRRIWGRSAGSTRRRSCRTRCTATRPRRRLRTA